MSRRARVALAAFLAVGGLVVFLLPFSLMLLPNPAPLRVTDMEETPTGVYLRASGAVYRLFPFGETQDDFPETAALARADSVVLVKYRNLSTLSAYTLHAYPSGREVSVRRTVRERDRLLELRPEALPPGRYYVSSAREGMWGGTDYVYFRVTEATAATP